MPLAPKNNWQPTASRQNLQARAQLLTTIRHFFAERGVLEVETPLLCHTSTPDPYIHSMEVNLSLGKFYLQTSPEFAMKRLLAADVGPIYQICKAFRGEEIGPRHNPEFSILEWYRPGFDHHAFMDEMDAFLQSTINLPKAQRFSYADIFQKYLAINPHAASITELKNCAQQNNIKVHGLENAAHDDWLNLLISHCIEPQIGFSEPVFIYDYPATQAALAKIRQEEFPVAERFEVYVNGIELANGFHELTDAKEQRQRFMADLEKRQLQKLPLLPVDENLLSALSAGFPACAGVAVGMDRLLMIALQAKNIAEVLSFTL